MLQWKPAAVIFDFDGVLINSFHIHKKAWMDAFDTLFMQPFPTLKDSKLTGKSSLHIAQTICDAADKSDMAFSLLETKNRILASLSVPPLVDGARQLIDQLKSNDIPFGICSNAHSMYIEQVTIQNGFSFPVILGFDTAPKPKPEPDGFELAAKLLGISHKDFDKVIVFEDSPTGLTAAIRAKMFAFGITYKESADELTSLGAAATAKDLQQVWRENLLHLN